MKRLTESFADPDSMETSAPHPAANDSSSGQAVTVPELPVLEDDGLPFEVETTGYDPYNSGSFDSAKWRTEK